MSARLSGSSVRPARKAAQFSAPSKQRSRASARPGNLRIAAILFGVIAVLTLPNFITCLNVPLAGETAIHAFAESIETFAGDCVTPKNAWDLGGTACAQVTGAIGDRRIIWVAPDGQIADISAPFNDSGSDTYPLTTTGPFAQYGTWRVISLDNSGTGFAITSFLVRPENQASADLSLLQSGPLQAFAGNDISYALRITNHGPDAAQGVTLSVAGPNDSTFASEAQSSGPTGNCNTPGVGSPGTSTCVIPSLAVGESAVFIFVYTVNAGTAVDTLIVNSATVSTTITELFLGDNQASHQTSVAGTPPPPQCTINCPADVSTDNDPNQCSAVVTYATPTTSGNCTDPETGTTAPVLCNPPSGSAFPIGPTEVTCSTAGETCSFTVTVNDTRPPVAPTITCPADVLVSEEFQGAGAATVDYAAPTATGNCVTVACEPPSGSVFPTGTTTVTCTVTDSSSNTATCEFTVTVAGVGCTIVCPDDVSVPNTPGQCSATVTYADPTTAGSCGPVTCTPPSGAVFPVGATAVTCSEPGGQSCSFTVTVTAGQISALADAQVWIGLKTSDDVGTDFDLLAEVFRNGVPIASGQIEDVPGGGSGFNNAHLRTITLALAEAESFCPGDVVTFKLSVRIAVSSNHVSGRARLWFNDAAANSRLGATVNGVASNYFLLDGFVLNTAAGPGPKKTIDVLVNRNVDGNAFKPFGTWTKTL